MKALDDRAADAADILPLHDEQTRLARMQKQVDDFLLVAPVLGRVADRIDANHSVIRGFS